MAGWGFGDFMRYLWKPPVDYILMVFRRRRISVQVSAPQLARTAASLIEKETGTIDSLRYYRLWERFSTAIYPACQIHFLCSFIRASPLARTAASQIEKETL